MRFFKSLAFSGENICFALLGLKFCFKVTWFGMGESAAPSMIDSDASVTKAPLAPMLAIPCCISMDCK